jgi:hypothetical protein
MPTVARGRERSRPTALELTCEQVVAGHGAFTDSLGFAALAACGNQEDRSGTAPVAV